jgi:hypothetical protein
VGIGVFRANRDVNKETMVYSRSFFTQIRRKFPTQKIIVACENAPAGSMLNVYKAMNDLGNFLFFRNCNPNTCWGLGVPVSTPVKEKICTDLAFSINEGTIVLDPDYLPMTNLPMVVDCVSFLSGFTFVKELARNQFHRVIRDERGKITGKDTGNDDIAMSIAHARNGIFLARMEGTILVRSRIDLITENREEHTEQLRQMRQLEDYLTLYD